MAGSGNMKKSMRENNGVFDPRAGKPPAKRAAAGRPIVSPYTATPAAIETVKQCYQQSLLFDEFAPVNINDVDSIVSRYNLCIQYILNNNICVIGNQLFYMLMDLNSQNISDMINHKLTDKHYEVAQNIKTFCATYREQAAMQGEIDRVVSIFLMKNYDGMTDQSPREINVNVNTPGTTREALVDAYTGDLQRIPGKTSRDD